MPLDPRMRANTRSYPFLLKDPVSGRCVNARFLEKIKDIADCYAAWEIMAPPPKPKPQ